MSRRHFAAGLLWLGILLGGTPVSAASAGGQPLRLAVAGFGGGSGNLAVCSKVELGEVLGDALTARLGEGWLVLGPRQVRRADASLPSPGGDQVTRLQALAEALPAIVVVGGTVDSEGVEVLVYDARTGLASTLPRVSTPRAPDGSHVGKLAGAIAEKLAPGAGAKGREPALVGFPGDTGLCAQLARAYRGFDRSSDAALRRTRGQLQRILARDPDAVRALALLAEVDARASGSAGGDALLNEGAEAATKAVLRAPELALSHWAQGLVHDYAGRIDSAIAAYRRAAELDHGFADPRVNEALLELKRGQLANAFEALDEAGKIDPRWAVIRLNKVHALVEAGDGRAALRAVEALSEAEKLAETVRLYRIHALVLTGRAAEALAELAPLLQGDEPSWHAQHERALALIAQGRASSALETVDALLAGQPAPTEASRALGELLARAQVSRARALNELGRGAEARSALRTLVEADSEIRYPLPFKALAVLTAGDEGGTEGAIALLAKVVERHPLDDEAWFDLGVLRGRNDAPDAAAQAYEKAVSINPRASWARLNLGLILLDKGEAARAEELLRSALELDPRAGDAATALGVALAKQGRAEEATTVWRGWLEKAGRMRPAPVTPPALLENISRANVAGQGGGKR